MRFAKAVGGFAVLAIAGGVGGVALTRPETVPPSALSPRNADLKNGATMFDIGGCSSCHATEKQDNRLLLGGGHELETPFGTFVVPNISSDPKAGMGAWTEPQFVSAMLKGTGRNGEHLFPAFPYTSYQRMKLDDVRDLHAFMKTLPAVATPSKPHRLSFPFNVRLAVGGWKLLYLDGRPFAPDPAKDATLNRGAYLVEGPGHCAECHSGRDPLGGIKASQRFAGGTEATGRGWVPNMTPHADGLAAWSEKDIAFFLESGMTPESYAVGSSMKDVIANTSKLPPEDRRAIALYIKSLPSKPGVKPKQPEPSK